jgi:2-polyprenyl-6-methoxyphenol hydroxylase-like FAD-dependent oxidoreductase
MKVGEYDAVVVGASAAGCAAARLLALRGVRVALVERRPDVDAYKAVCTHFIQSSATPTIERLGLARLIERAGAVRNCVDFWSPYGGWVRAPSDAPYGYNVTRRTLDPLLRRLAADTPGVELLTGQTAVSLLGDGRPAGLEAQDLRGTRRRLRARLVVAADGRGSALARMAGVRGRVRPNGRFFYWSYWRGLRPRSQRSRFWLLDPDAAYTFPNENDLTVILVGVHRDRLGEFRADLEGAYERTVESLPDPPDLTGATRESKLLGKLEVPNVSRPAAVPGLAFVGDAAMASDPLWGVGCGWAFQSAEWLADRVGDALVGGHDVDGALARYRREHQRRLGPHHFLISDIASGRRANAFERRLYSTAARDEVVLRAFEGVGSRRRSPATLFGPRVAARLLGV